MPRIFTFIEPGDVDDEAQPSVIAGTVLVTGIAIFSLIVTGATHSFISTSRVARLRLVPELADCLYSVMLPSGKLMQSDRVFKGNVIFVGNNTLFARLIVMGIKQYDLILGMDWLSRHFATIECRSGMVTFHPSNKEKFTFQAMNRTSELPTSYSIMVQEQFKDRCSVYLAIVADTQLLSGVKPSNLLIVREFTEIFLDNLPGLPPDREIEFVIDVYPGSEPVSKNPYRLAFADLKEFDMVALRKGAV